MHWKITFLISELNLIRDTIMTYPLLFGEIAMRSFF